MQSRTLDLILLPDTFAVCRPRTPLADAGISVFAISTFDTDYLLVKQAPLEIDVAGRIGGSSESGREVKWNSTKNAGNLVDDVQAILESELRPILERPTGPD